ncbi:response regulator [Desulfurivibrio alkaliphilus]|uniref:Response regulator receiver protein n=1 Tax=Desulfurivibrio alkaliphilus (strain DSM 19089 / UNIQEM U267 / AHT2) TaxID=589865 RepID=D6Z0E0_DESAT|nr:response regulator [Desulfurivibrio alkaliphilus]ADH87173.1 response regulator receiver protein [Desulfurivibrio alkaliphilus AHT 2]
MAEKILLIDDEAEFVETLAARMRSRQMEVSTATSAVEALQREDVDSYDAIVLDLQMPGMDGLAALEEIKKRNPQLQVILLTGKATVEKGVQAMKMGAMDLLEKPADIDELTRKIKEAGARKMVLVTAASESQIKEIIGNKAW